MPSQGNLPAIIDTRTHPRVFMMYVNLGRSLTARWPNVRTMEQRIACMVQFLEGTDKRVERAIRRVTNAKR